MKQLATMLLSLTLVMTLLLPVSAADSAKATTMRLSSTEGTVTMTNQNGRSLTVKNAMQLYSGYTIKTGAASYAYVGLDNSKAVKLDAFTTAEVRKSGKKLEVLVTAGKIFFNVTAPLAQDETMEIRTSTIVTGIRGTSGIIDCVDEKKSILHLLEGTVTIQGSDSATGQSVPVTVQAGQTAVVTKQPTTSGATAPEVPKVQLSGLTPKDVPGFVATEIAKDTVLQEKISQQSKLDVKEVVKQAEQTLAVEQKAAVAQQKKVEQTLPKTEQKPNVVPTIPTAPAPQPPKESTPSDTSGGSDSPTPSPNPPPEPPIDPPTPPIDPPTPPIDPPEPPIDPPTPPIDPPTPPIDPPEPPIDPPTPPADGTVLTGEVTEQALVAALANDRKVILQSDSPVEIAAQSTIQVPDGKTLVLRAPASRSETPVLMLASGARLEVSGELCIEADGLLNNDGTLVLPDSGRITGERTAELGEVSYMIDPIEPLAADVTHGGTTGAWRVAGMAALLGQLDAADTATIQVHASGSLHQSWQVQANQNITIDLNGLTLEVISNQPVDGVVNDGSLTLKDTSGSGGTLDLDGYQLKNHNTLIIGQGASVSSTNDTATIINGSSAARQSQLKMTGGTVRNSGNGNAIQNHGAIDAKDGRVESEGGSPTITNGNTDNTAASVSVFGSCQIVSTGSGAVAIQSFGPVTVSGGRIEGETGVHLLNNAGSVRITNGVISGSTNGIINESAPAENVVIDGDSVIVERTTSDSTAGGYAIDGLFTFENGKVRAQEEANVCSNLPTGCTYMGDGGGDQGESWSFIVKQ